MNVRVRMFAVAKQIVGRGSVDVALPEGATVKDLRRALIDQAPELAAVIDQCRLAVDAEYADDTSVIPAGADVACIPPVSGG